LAKDFLDYILSPGGQKLLVQEGLISMNPLPESKKKTGDRRMSKEKILERSFLLIALSSISILALIAFSFFSKGFL